MIHELPLGNLTLSTDNLLYQVVCEKFVELLKEEPNRLLTILSENQTNAESLTHLKNKISDLEIKNQELRVELDDAEKELQDELDGQEEEDLGLDYIWFKFDKNNLLVREKFTDFVRSCQPTLSQQKSLF